MKRKYPNTPEGDQARKEARMQSQRAFRAANRERYSQEDRQRKFGLTPHEYNEMVASQGNRCAICKCHETATRKGKIKALAVDHDHKTGAIRGLLCADCNTGIGKLKESRSALIEAVRYLDRHSNEAVVVKFVPTKGVK